MLQDLLRDRSSPETTIAVPVPGGHTERVESVYYDGGAADDNGRILPAVQRCVCCIYQPHQFCESAKRCAYILYEPVAVFEVPVGSGHLRHAHGGGARRLLPVVGAVPV